LLGLCGGIVGEQLGWWSLRAVMNRTVEMVRQQVALISGMAAAPEAVGVRDQGRQVAPLARRELPTATSGTAVAPASQESARIPTSPASLPSSQLRASAPAQPISGAKELAIKKVVVIRSGDTLSRILAQEYGEYTKAVVDLVSEANPGLRNIHFLEIGQRLILPERPE
jgi:phage tail protein X